MAGTIENLRIDRSSETADRSAVSMQPANPDPQKRVNVIFSAQQYQVLSELASKRGVNISDILRQAISIMKLVVEANEDGKILIERKGKMQQLKLV